MNDMNDDQYNPFYKRAVDMQYKFHDYVGQAPYDPRADVLKHEIRQLVEDTEMKKNPRTLENRVKVIQRQIREAQHNETPMMNYGHLEFKEMQVDVQPQAFLGKVGGCSSYVSSEGSGTYSPARPRGDLSLVGNEQTGCVTH